MLKAPYAAQRAEGVRPGENSGALGQSVPHLRYRSKCSLWWPAAGEDVDFRVLPDQPGKAVQLELKTTVSSGANQDVMIDLGQLWEYLQRPAGSG